MADGKASSFCVHSFFLSQSKTPELCSVVFPPFLLRPKKKLLGNAVSGNMEKKDGKKPSGKKLEVFLLMIFRWGSKILRKQGDFLKFNPWGLVPSWFLLEKHKAQTTPLKLILRSKIQSKRLAPLWIILLAEIRLSYGFYGLIDFLCLGKILSSAAACCFWKKFQSGCIWWDVTAINQSYARERHQVKLPLSRLKYSRRLNPCSSWWFRNPKQPPFVWKEPWILTGWSINWCRSSETSTVSFQTFYSIPQVYIICVFVAMSLLLTSIITRPHIPGPLTQVTLENTTFCPKRKQNRLPFHCQPFFRDVPSLFCLRDGNDWQRII